MCGVVGYTPLSADVTGELSEDRTRLFSSLMMESRVRGMHAYGVAQPGVSEPMVVKSHEISEVCAAFDPTRPAIAHCRYSTSGDWSDHRNNQPIVVGHRAIALNGVIDMGTKEEMEARWGLKLESENDAEIVLRLLEVRRYISLEAMVESMLGSIAFVILDGSTIHCSRNARRPLWTAHHHGALWIASTRDIFARCGVKAVSEVVPT